MRPALLLVLLGALLLRLWHLGARSFWTDEASSWATATAPLPGLFRLCAEKDASPPLFYLLVRLATGFGGSEVPPRMVSVIASLAMVWLTYRFARLIASPGTATVAAAITALSPFQLMYAQEARPNMTVSCLLVLSLYLFARTVVQGRARAFLPYVLASTLALYTQSIALLGVGVQAACVVMEPRARRGLKRWLAGQLAALLLFLPWLAVGLKQTASIRETHWYAPAPDLHGVFQVLRAVFLSPVPVLSTARGASDLGALLPHSLAFAFLILLPVVPLAAAAIAMVRRREGGDLARLAAYGLVLPPVAVLAVSLRVPLWIPRYFVFLTPMVAVLLAFGLARLRPRALGALWAALLLTTATYACWRYDRDYTKERWREVAARIAAESAPGRAAALVPFDLAPFDFYNRRQRSPVPAFEVSHPEVPFAFSFTPRQLEQMERGARVRTAPYDEVWVVVRSPNSPGRKEVARRCEVVAATGRAFIGRDSLESSAGPLRMARYRRAAADSIAMR